MKKSILFLMFASLVAVGGLSSTRLVSVQAEATSEGIDLTRSYFVGQIIDFSNAKITYKGQDYKPDYFSFTYPSGIKTTAKNIELKENGACVIYMYVMIEGNKIECNETIDVLKNLCESKNGKSTAELKYNSLFEENGIDIRLGQKDEVKINKVIDLKQSHFNDEDSFIDFYFNPLTQGKPDAFTFYMTLTDIYDENNYIKVRMKSWSDMGTWADGNTYIDCKTQDQEYTTCCNNLEDFYFAKRDQNTKHGWYISKISMCGRNEAGYAQNDKLRFFFDYGEKRIVTNNAYYSPDHPYEIPAITDFDNPRYYNLNKEKLWEGFTTGEVYASFSAEDFNGATANLFITSMLGVDFTEEFKDLEAPEIVVDLQEYTESTLPFAVIDRKYRIFHGYAYDTSDKYCAVDTNVYFDYYGKKILVNADDGYFIPTKEGKYTIEYSALDTYGNRAVKTIEVDAFKDSEYSSFLFTSNQIAKTGIRHKVIDGVKMENFNGTSKLTVTLKNGDQTIVLDDSYSFIPQYSCIYDVTVEASDYVKTFVREFKLYVTANNRPVFDENYSARKYYVKDVEYKLENPQASVFSSTGFSKINSVAYYSNDGINYSLIENNIVTFDTAGLIYLKYVAQNEGQTSELFATAEVIDVDRSSGLVMQNYFKCLKGNVHYESTDLDMSILFTDNTAIEFINPLQVNDFIANFNLIQGLNDVDKINFYLTDAHNENIELKLSYEKNIVGGVENGAIFRINDSNEKIYVAQDFSGLDINLFRLEYDDNDKTIMPSNITVAKPVTCLNGNPFEGFTSNFAYLKIEFEGVNDNGGIHNLKLNGQSFLNFDEDIFEPQILVKRNSGVKNLNDIITLERPIFADVFSDNITGTMSVRTPSGEYAKALDGTVLNTSCDVTKDYQILCSEIGSYKVTYHCEDGAGMEADYRYQFSVVDNIPPTITVSDMVTSAKVGDTVQIAKPIIKDNYSETTYFVIVEAPDGSMQSATDSFVATMAGTYKVFYYVSDADGNIVIAYYCVEVK